MFKSLRLRISGSRPRRPAALCAAAHGPGPPPPPMPFYINIIFDRRLDELPTITGVGDLGRGFPVFGPKSGLSSA